ALVFAGLAVAVSALGFAFTEAPGWPILVAGLVLGIGWGVFYTLAPILVAAVIDSGRRTHFFALLSGSMMAGIGTGPIAGRFLTAMGLPIESAVVFAAVACLGGAAIYAMLGAKLSRAGGAMRGNKIGLHATIRIL